MNSAIVPVPPFESDCYDQRVRHAQILEIKDAVDPEVVLIGDSITHFWGGEPVTPGAPRNGLDSFAATFAGLRVLNLGYGFDRTQNVLWRLADGELDNLRPRVAVVNIGTNNLFDSARFRANTPAETLEGVEAVCSDIERRCPGVRIVLMHVFPRGRMPDDFHRAPVAALNALLAPMADRHGWTRLDIGPGLLAPDGEFPPDMASDGTHPTAKGYAVWGKALKPCL